MMPTLETKKARTHEAILASALQLFAQHGFNGTTVPAIAVQAGVASGTMYRHFDSKEALVNEVYRRCKQEMMQSLLVSFPFMGTPNAQFCAYWRALLLYGIENPQTVTFLELHHHGDYLDVESVGLARASMDPVSMFISRGQAMGQIRVMSTDAMLAMIWGSAMGLLASHIRAQIVLDDALIEETMARVWLMMAS